MKINTLLKGIGLSLSLLVGQTAFGQSVGYSLEKAEPMHRFSARVGVAVQAPLALMLRTAGDYKISKNLWVEGHALLPAMAFGNANDKIKRAGTYLSAGIYWGFGNTYPSDAKVILSQSSSEFATYRSTSTKFIMAKNIPTYTFAGLRAGLFTATVAHNVNAQMANLEEKGSNNIIADSNYVGKVMATSTGLYVGLGWGYERDDYVQVDGYGTIKSRYITRNYFDFLYLPTTSYGNMTMNQKTYLPVNRDGRSHSLAGVRMGADFSRKMLNFGAELGFACVWDKKSRPEATPLLNGTGFIWINLFAGITLSKWN